MATETSTELETVADLLKQLHVPPERILLRPPPGEATEEDLLKSRRLCELDRRRAGGESDGNV